jgi:hypothetical protein
MNRRLHGASSVAGGSLKGRASRLSGTENNAGSSSLLDKSNSSIVIATICDGVSAS